MHNSRITVIFVQAIVIEQELANMAIPAEARGPASYVAGRLSIARWRDAAADKTRIANATSSVFAKSTGGLGVTAVNILPRRNELRELHMRVPE